MGLTLRPPADWPRVSVEHRFHILSTGTYVDMNRREVSFAQSDLQTIADDYDPALMEAPIVIGHPKHDNPAYGWIKRLEREGNKLYAVATDLASEFVEWLEAKRYKKRSASLMLPDQSPTGDWYLRHLGFLGAAPPAVPGLEPHQFADASGAVTLDLSGGADTEAAAADLADNGVLQRFVQAFNALVRAHTSDASDPDADVGSGDDDSDDDTDDTPDETASDPDPTALESPNEPTKPMPLNFADPAHPGDVMNAAIEEMATDDRPRSALVEDLAEEMGVEPATVNQILDGDITDVPEERLRAAAAMLRGVSVDDLMDALPGTSADMSASTRARERRLRARERRLEERERKARRDDAASFASSLKDEGKLLPRHEDTVTEALYQLEEADADASVDLSAHGGEANTSVVDALKSMLEELGQTVEFAELAAPDGDADAGPASVDFEAPSGTQVRNTSRMKLHKRAKAYQQKHNVSYNEAVDAVA